MPSSPNLSIPQRCSVLVVGGGPAGAFTASILAREGIDVVLLEAEAFPRYHIGETMLPAMRHLLRFVDADSKFEKHGFIRKTGSAFKLHKNKREGYTDFIAVGGQDNFTWNLVRSESDQILFDHAKESGARVFDQVRVTTILFDKDDDPVNARPNRAKFLRRSDSSGGEISFDYLVDASGRAGLLSTKYLKNRKYNSSLKNVAMWTYWKDTEKYALGTSRENTPLTEALADESGWAWYIPLHTGHSVGVVLDQGSFSNKKSLQSPSRSSTEFYLEQLKLAPTIFNLLAPGTPISDSDGSITVRTASDYSYDAASYSTCGSRIVGDAGAFIDPFFSSGVHLAMMGGMSAALSICAAIRGDCSEEEAGQWHSKRVATSYTWFLLVVLGAYKQIRSQEEPLLSDIDEDNFDRAFAFLTPVIQGSTDIQNRVSHAERASTLELCSKIFGSWNPLDREALLCKLTNSYTFQIPASAQAHKDVILNNFASSLISSDAAGEIATASLSGDEKLTLENAQARKLIRIEDTLNITNFITDVIDKKVPHLERGALGLRYLSFDL